MIPASAHPTSYLTDQMMFKARKHSELTRTLCLFRPGLRGQTRELIQRFARDASFKTLNVLWVLVFVLGEVAPFSLAQESSEGLGKTDRVAQSEQPKEGSSNSKSKPLSDVDFWAQKVRPFLKEYCADCHFGEGSEADVDFEGVTSIEQMTEQRPRWNQVRGLIEIGAMPPADYEPLPTRKEREEIADWIDRKLNTVDCQVVNDPGRVTMRRLNNYEYDRSVQDLLHIDVKPSEHISFPSDGVGNGFDNQGDVLTLSPLQLEKYLQAARYVVDQVILDDLDAYRKQRKDLPSLFRFDEASEEFLFAKGSYEISVRMKFEQQVSKDEPIPVALLVDGEEVTRWHITEKSETWKFTAEFEPGRHQVGLRFVEDPGSKRKEYRRRVDVNLIQVEGPKRGPAVLPESYRKLFVARPSEVQSLKAQAERALQPLIQKAFWPGSRIDVKPRQRIRKLASLAWLSLGPEQKRQSVSVAQAAERIFRPLIRKAFRREPTEADLQRVVGLVELAVGEGESFDDAVGFGLQSILVSPHFLFRVESVPGVVDGSLESLNEYSLATRLSYFIWGSLPDERLLDLARDRKLGQPEVLQGEVRRMLADDRSNALVERFFGQYLGLGSLQEVTPDADKFPLWNEKLAEAVVRETQLFCKEIIRQDLPLDVLLTGDFTYINPRMAEMYGYDFEGQDPAELYREGPGLRRRTSRDRNSDYKHEDRWVRVELPPERRGVLTHASILTLTSNPTTTSPVKRGKWILETILGDPPPPAPPNVPSFEETQEGHKDLSLREQLAIHRENPSCASCHRVMDPLGLGFEHFNTIGQWRDKDGRHPIDAGGELADGRKFDGAAELVQLLKRDREAIYRHFADKLLTYALGRGLEPFDACAIDKIMQDANSRDFKMSAFVESVVLSQPFRMRRPGELSQFEEKKLGKFDRVRARNGQYIAAELTK